MFAPETLNASLSSSSTICQQQCDRHLTDGLASSPSIIVTGIDFPMFALYITKAILLLSYVCTSSPNHFFLLLIIHTFPLLKKRACLQKMDLNLSCTFDIYFFSKLQNILSLQRPPSSSLSGYGLGNDEARSPSSGGGTPGLLSHQPGSHISGDNISEAGKPRTVL